MAKGTDENEQAPASPKLPRIVGSITRSFEFSSPAWVDRRSNTSRQTPLISNGACSGGFAFRARESGASYEPGFQIANFDLMHFFNVCEHCATKSLNRATGTGLLAKERAQAQQA